MVVVFVILLFARSAKDPYGERILGSGLFGIAGLIFAVPVTAVLYRLLADWTNERARQRGVPIIDTVPGVKYDLRGHVRRSFKKKKNNASSGSGRLRTKETKTETGESARWMKSFVLAV